MDNRANRLKMVDIWVSRRWPPRPPAGDVESERWMVEFGVQIGDADASASDRRRGRDEFGEDLFVTACSPAYFDAPPLDETGSASAHHKWIVQEKFDPAAVANRVRERVEAIEYRDVEELRTRLNEFLELGTDWDVER